MGREPQRLHMPLLTMEKESRRRRCAASGRVPHQTTITIVVGHYPKYLHDDRLMINSRLQNNVRHPMQ